MSYIERLKECAVVFKYIIARMLKPDSCDRLIFNPDKNGWILTKIGRVLLERGGILSSNIKDIGGAKEVIFLHYLPYVYAIRAGIVTPEKSIIWFTHPRESIFSEKYVVRCLAQAKKVVFQCEQFKDEFSRKYEVYFKNCKVLWGGVDSSLFEERYQLRILVNSKFYQRKNAALIEKYVKENPDCLFYFLGSGWDFIGLQYQNVILINSSYSNYGEIYKQVDVLLSVSKVEGGPIPVLEAKAFKKVIISTKTGVVCDSDWNYKKTVLVDESSDSRVAVERAKGLVKVKEDSGQNLIWHEFARKFYD